MPNSLSVLRRYLWSCGLLLVPVLAWNAVLTPHLTGPWASETFWRDIPPIVALFENAARTLVVILPFLVPLELGTRQQRSALAFYALGLALYFASWPPVLLAPNSLWSTSAWGFLAPAYTPALWLAALTLLGRQLFWGAWYRRWMYSVPAAIFLAAHLAHAAIVFQRLP